MRAFKTNVILLVRRRKKSSVRKPFCNYRFPDAFDERTLFFPYRGSVWHICSLPFLCLFNVSAGEWLEHWGALCACRLPWKLLRVSEVAHAFIAVCFCSVFFFIHQPTNRGLSISEFFPLGAKINDNRGRNVCPPLKRSSYSYPGGLMVSLARGDSLWSLFRRLTNR